MPYMKIISGGLQLSFPSILKESLTITAPRTSPTTTAHDVRLHIVTADSPITARPCRLAPERLWAAQTEIEHMLRLGIMSPSSSPWTFPVHEVSKSNGDWLTCGHHRALENATVPDSSLILYIQDFSKGSWGKSIFEKLYLMHAYCCISKALEDIPKTTITKPFDRH